MGLIFSNTTKEEVETSSLPRAVPHTPPAFQTPQGSGELLKLSADVLIHVCKFLDLIDIYSLSICNRYFSQILNSKENDFIWKFEEPISFEENSKLSYRELAIQYLIPTTVCDVTLTLHGPAVITSLEDIQSNPIFLKQKNRHPTNRYRLPFYRYSRSSRNHLAEQQVQIFTTPFPTAAALSDPRFKEAFERQQQSLQHYKQQIAQNKKAKLLDPRLLQQHSIGYFGLQHECFTCEERAGDYHYQQFIEPNSTDSGPPLVQYDTSIRLIDGSDSSDCKGLLQLFKQYKVLYFRVFVKAERVPPEQLKTVFPDDGECEDLIYRVPAKEYIPPVHEKPFTGGYLISNILKVEYRV